MLRGATGWTGEINVLLLLLAAGPDGVGVLGSGGRGGAIAVSRSRAIHGVGVFLAPVALIVIGCGLVNEVGFVVDLAHLRLHVVLVGLIRRKRRTARSHHPG